MPVLPSSARGRETCGTTTRAWKPSNRIGIEFDSSALPGRTKTDPGWQVDWATTPSRRYRPSVADYRVPGSPRLAICEVPLSTVSIRAPYDAAPLARYVDPCVHPSLLWQNLEAALADMEYLLCILHPDEVVPRTDAGGHPLIAYRAVIPPRKPATHRAYLRGARANPVVYDNRPVGACMEAAGR
jgi:hypothetical protein